MFCTYPKVHNTFCFLAKPLSIKLLYGKLFLVYPMSGHLIIITTLLQDNPLALSNHGPWPLYKPYSLWSPFQRQLTILQNAINNWHTLRDNISDPRAETLSQTGVSCSYALCVIIAKYVPIQRHFYDKRKIEK